MQNRYKVGIVCHILLEFRGGCDRRHFPRFVYIERMDSPDLHFEEILGTAKLGTHELVRV